MKDVLAKTKGFTDDAIKNIRLYWESWQGRRLYVLARIMLAAIYFAAAIPKFFNAGLFKVTIAAYYGFLPDALALVLSIVVPWVEFGLAALLLYDEKRQRLCAGLLMLLSCYYVVNSIIFLNQWMPYGCGCFGFNSGETLGISGVARNVLIAAVGVLAYIGARTGKSDWHGRSS